MGKLFGTDGIRGVAHIDPVTAQMGMKLGKAVVGFGRRRGGGGRVVIGRDTRESGKILEQAVAAGVFYGGGEPCLAGEIPTPAVAMLTMEMGAGAGIVVSASHNPYEYNGFKLFTEKGFKLSEREEAEIEDMILNSPEIGSPANFPGPGSLENAVERYEAFLRRTVPSDFSLEGMKIVLDCANGATWRVAPSVLKGLRGEIHVLHAKPDGKNINRRCGSEHTDSLQRAVLEMGADAGLAFDGDGDRIIAVDEEGHVLSGDQFMTVCARMLKQKGELDNDLVVSTVMSNMGLRLALRELGVNLVSTDVGDRNVMEAMRAGGALLGGEDSGHIIFANHHTTGDGIVSGLQLMRALRESGDNLSKLSGLMKVYPQVLINVKVRAKPPIESVGAVAEVIEAVKRKLKDSGRVLVRYSGTEPLCRVMLEGEKEDQTEVLAQEIASAIERELGGS